MNGTTSKGVAFRPRKGAPRQFDRDSLRRAALITIKVVHSLAYFALEFCVGYVIYAGLTQRQDRKTALAATAIAAESLIFFGNGRRCPLTGLAEELGAAHGSVTDIYLPRWLASRIFTIHVPLVILAACLHARITWERLRSQRPGGGRITKKQ